MSIPNSATERTPIDKIFKPRIRRINARVQRFDIVEERFVNVRDVFFHEEKVMAFFIAVSVFHIEKHGQFKQATRVGNNLFTEVRLLRGVGRGERIRVMISTANKPCVVSP